MDILEFLFNTAVKSIWSNPKGDKNAIFRTNKLTTPAGAVGLVNLPFGNIALPETGRRYMLVELGEVTPSLVGFENPLYGWVSLQSVVDNFQTLVFGFCRGRMISLDGSYIQLTEDGNILFAIDYVYNLKLISMNDDFYIRFYTNIFYDGNVPSPAQSLSVGTFHKSSTANSVYSDYLSFSGTLASLTALKHVAPMIYKNGLYLPDGLPAYSDLAVGDIVDYISDPFIIATDALNLQDMDSYHSTLDNANKVIASVEPLDNNVYVDDTECYVTGVTPSGVRVGAYFPRLSPAVIRNLTSKDLALNSLQIDARLSELENFKDINHALTNVKIYVLRRDNQQFKPLLLDSNYIPDLMNLPTSYRRQALTGVNATMPTWNANTLESCPFNMWCGLLPNQLTFAHLTNVYSRYGALTYYERVRQLPGKTGWSLPAIAGSGGGVLQSYGTNGIGVSFTHYTTQDHTNETYPNGHGYELFYPQQDNTSPLDLVVAATDGNPTVVDAGFDIFCYYLKDGALTYAIFNVDYTLTDTNSGTTIITWRPQIQGYERYVRTTKQSVIFSRTVTLADIEAGIDIYNGRAKTNEIGMGILSIWYNGRYLIEGLDYIVHNAKAYLISKTQYWTDTATLDVVYAGIPHSSMQHVPQNNWGWVKYGKLFNDGKYDLLMYRGALFYVDGRAIPFSDIYYKEGYTDLAITQNALPFVDGTPFAVTEAVQISRTDLLDTVSRSKAAEKILDTTLSNYLSVLDPQVPQTGIIVVPKLYRLVSPLMDALIKDILNGTLQIIYTTYSDDDIQVMMVPYMDLLRVDPCLLGMDQSFTQISPMWNDNGANVTVMQFNFLTRVNTVMLNGQVQGLHLYLTITNTI